MLIELFHDFAMKLQVDQNMLQFLQKRKMFCCNKVKHLGANKQRWPGKTAKNKGGNLFYFRGRTCKGGREGEIVMGSMPTEFIGDSHVCNNLCLTQSCDSFSCLAQGKFSIILRFFNIIFHPLEKQSLETKQSMLTIPDG